MNNRTLLYATLSACAFAAFAVTSEARPPTAGDQMTSVDATKAAEAQRHVRGVPRDYRPAHSGPSSMRDLGADEGGRTGPRRVTTQAPGTSALPQGPGGFQGAGPTFNVQKFAQNIHDLLKGNQTAGYALAIAQNGQLVNVADAADGKLRKQSEGNINQSATRRQNIASISKMITAVAVLQLMDKLNLTLDDKIEPYLPASWERGPNVKNLKFKHLLTHTTGFTSTNSDFWNTLSWDGLKTMVKQGASPGAPRQYLNANFALFRFIIPAMWKQAGTQYPIYTENGTAAAFWYIFYVQKKIFDPIGVTMAQCVDPSSSTEALYYDPAMRQSGLSAGDWNMICASGGWVLSANDLVNFMANVRYNNQILKPAMRKLMMDERLGMNRTAGAHGDYFSHGGAISYGNNRGMVMCLMRYSINVEAAVLVNSPVSTIPTNFCSNVLAGAFDDAWN